MITVSAWFAFFDRGSLNAVTPFETASTPVMAAHPLAKAFSSSHKVRYCIVVRNRRGRRRSPAPDAHRQRTQPVRTHAIVTSSVPTNRNVGTMKARPDSFTPRRFTITMMRENHQAQRQLVRMQPRDCTHQRRYAGRDTHRCRQDVVDHQRRGRQQPRAIAQVFARDRERAAPVRVRLDRLPIAEVQNRQQNQDRRRRSAAGAAARRQSPAGSAGTWPARGRMPHL